MVSKKDVAERPDADVAMRAAELSLNVVQSFSTPDDIERYFQAQGLELSYGQEISDGYEILENKDRLISTTFIIVDWHKFDSAEFNQEATTVRLMTMTGEKLRISDGSTGIHAQLDEIYRARVDAGHPMPNAGVVVKNGLTKSEYWVSIADGKAMTQKEAEETPADLRKKAKTYYLVF